jgi:predicted dehydrogenase
VVVGLVGCGVWGAHVLRDLRLLGADVEVVARSAESVGRAKDGGAARVVRDIQSLRDVAALVVVTPIATHAPVLREALAVGVPTFVEKPLCDDVGDAEELAALAPGQLFVMDKWRYHPGIAVLERLAATEALGQVHGLRTIRVQPDNRHAEDATWVLVPHELAIAFEILGEIPRPRAASGQWEGDRLLTLHALLSAERGWHVCEVSQRAPAVERRIELHCDAGLAVLGDAWDEHVLVHRPGVAEPERLDAAGELPLLAELRAFLGFVEGGLPPKSSVAEGAAAVRTVAELRALAA